MTHPPIIQIVGYKNTGKTTLILRLIAELRARGYRVGTAKRDAHDFEIDHEGRDTWRHYEAGADAVAITSAGRSALIRRAPATLEQLASAMPEVDLVLAEGFKTSPYAKIVLYTNDADRDELCGTLTGVFAAGTMHETERLILELLAKADELGIAPSGRSAAP
ncbi:molybdopterin-guanine dinucleotide biosynthesis protein B [Paenibacillus chartarius]|uniref:Molybdopterin-guanine dinucleotide biosynthesis protein B n=1 Tax=Paenibacillus chartarius TaxID=747481 RepID=A0ABV6DGI9_9BACL